MDPQLISECAKHAVMVRVRGQDSLGVKTLGRPFHKISGGYTTLSASGLLLDRRSGLVMTSATLLAPFLQSDTLRKGVVVEILTNGLSGVLEEEEPSVKWIPAKLVRTLKDETIKSLLMRFKGDSDWVAGWPRNSDSSSGHLGEMDLARRESMSTSFWSGFEDMALLQLESESSNQAIGGRRAKLLALRRDQPPQFDLNIVDPSTIKRGNHLLLIASPYGILSPSVFHNCVYTAMVSNVISLQTDASTPTSDDDIPETNTSINNSSPNFTQNAQPKSRTQRLKTAVLNSFPPPTPAHPCVLLIDQPGLPGCEGGPIFDSNGSLIGLLAPPLRRSDGSNVEVHLVLPIQPFLVQIRDTKLPLLERLPSKKADIKLAPAAAEAKGGRRLAVPSDSPVVRPRSMFNHPAMQDSTEIAKRTLPAIVVISTGTYWGSGVVISPAGFILTAAHIFRSFLAPSSTALKPLLKPGYHVDIRIDSDEVSSTNSEVPISRPKWHRASLIFISSSHLDVAIVKLDRPPSGLTVLPICGASSLGASSSGISATSPSSSREPTEGEPVLALGYALFGPSKRIKATVTSGVISRVANLHGQPKLVQTSAIVNKGASGGAIVDSSGQFVGLVTCNAMTKDGVIIPKINFSIPAGVLAPVAEFVRNPSAPGASDVLLSIETKDADCASLWSMSALSDEPDPLPTRPASNVVPIPVSPDGQRGAKLIEFWNTQLPNPASNPPRARL